MAKSLASHISSNGRSQLGLSSWSLVSLSFNVRKARMQSSEKDEWSILLMELGRHLSRLSTSWIFVKWIIWLDYPVHLLEQGKDALLREAGKIHISPMELGVGSIPNLHINDVFYCLPVHVCVIRAIEVSRSLIPKLISDESFYLPIRRVNSSLVLLSKSKHHDYGSFFHYHASKAMEAANHEGFVFRHGCTTGASMGSIKLLCAWLGPTGGWTVCRYFVSMKGEWSFAPRLDVVCQNRSGDICVSEGREACSWRLIKPGVYEVDLTEIWTAERFWTGWKTGGLIMICNTFEVGNGAYLVLISCCGLCKELELEQKLGSSCLRAMLAKYPLVPATSVEQAWVEEFVLTVATTCH
ncbi:hypothetical protein Tco_0634577 [Tanacetum coccineum]